MAELKLITFPTRHERVADVLCDAAMLGAEELVVIALRGGDVEVLATTADMVVVMGMIRVAEHALFTE